MPLFLGRFEGEDNIPIEPRDFVLSQGGGDEGLFAEVLGDLEHLVLLAGEGVFDVARGVLDCVRQGAVVARRVAGAQQVRHDEQTNGSNAVRGRVKEMNKRDESRRRGARRGEERRMRRTANKNKKEKKEKRRRAMWKQKKKNFAAFVW